MDDTNEKQPVFQEPVWVISRTGFGIPKDIELYPEIKADAVIEYVISDFARYMLDPNPMEIEKRLVGCEIHRKPSRKAVLRSKINQWIPWIGKAKEVPPDLVLAQPLLEAPSPKDRHFVHHVDQINELLRAYDGVPRTLSSLDRENVSDIVGICEDIDGNRSILHLEGDIQNKMDYMKMNFAKNVKVILESRQLSSGLFEMRGFDFSSYRPENQYRLIRFFSNGESKACVIGTDKKVEYWITDMNVIQYMLLLDQSIQENIKFQNAFRLCISGERTPIKILFNSNFEIGYTDSYLPELYRDIFKTCHLGLHEKDVVVASLNQLKLGVAFTYTMKEHAGKQKLFTHISVLHNVKALETIRRHLPKLYSEINKRIPISDTRRFYLLDSIRGYIYA
ncbi:MAG: hypothetical protein ABIK15_00495 [Pseudomonadota bacterium]